MPHEDALAVQPSLYLPGISPGHPAQDEISLRGQRNEHPLFLKLVREPLALGNDCLYPELKVISVRQGLFHRNHRRNVDIIRYFYPADKPGDVGGEYSIASPQAPQPRPLAEQTQDADIS